MGRSKRNSESRMGKIILLLTLLFLFEHANSKIIIVSKIVVHQQLNLGLKTQTTAIQF